MVHGGYKQTATHDWMREKGHVLTHLSALSMKSLLSGSCGGFFVMPTDIFYLANKCFFFNY